MASICRVLSCVLASLVWPSAALAQPSTTESMAELGRWDVAFMAATYSARPDLDVRERYGDDWFTTGQGGVIVGRRWSSRLKTEVSISATGEGRQYVQYFVDLPDVPYPIPFGGEQLTTTRQVSLSALWTPFENQWVEPFVETGVVFDVESTRFYSPGTVITTGDPRTAPVQRVVIEERRVGPDTRTKARAVVGGGAKLYLTQRFFVRTDARIGVGSGVRHLSLRAGLGIDF